MTLRSYLKQIWAPEAGSTFVATEDGRVYEVGKGRTIPVKPHLATVRSAPSREAFDAWRDHPVTQFVFAAYRGQAEHCQATWFAQSWAGGNADQKALDELRTRADMYRALEDSDYEAFCDAAGLEPQAEG